MNWFEALVLGIVQGLTEYLPVSSSGHLAIGSYLFGVNGEDNLAFTVLVHVATVLSTLVVLWKEIDWILKGLFKFKMNDETKYFLNIVMPGLSRSGSTIATGLLLGNKKEKLAQFSFLMVIPPILGEALLDVLKAVKGEEAFGNIDVLPLAVGFVAAFVSGCVACKWMINIVKKGKLVWFGVYCAIAGAVTIVCSLL